MPRERIKRKRKEKQWYGVLAPQTFGKAKIAETPADDPEKLIGRNVEISLQELTNDFAKSHIKLKFKIVNTKGLEANTVFVGHSLTTDYVKRMSRKHRSKVDGVFDVKTKDGILVRLKPSALAGKRIQTSQKRAIRAILKETMEKEAKDRNFEQFIKFMLDGDLGKEAYRLSKKIYPIKRVEVYKSEVLEIPKVEAIADIVEEEVEQTEEGVEKTEGEETEEVAPAGEEAPEEAQQIEEQEEPSHAETEEQEEVTEEVEAEVKEEASVEGETEVQEEGEAEGEKKKSN